VNQLKPCGMSQASRAAKVAIGAVTVGHWLLTSITYRNGRLSGLDAINYVSWAGWVTLVFQVMPTFFLVGGYVHALSWARRRERGEHWAGWLREHAMQLLWPTAPAAPAPHARTAHRARA